MPRRSPRCQVNTAGLRAFPNYCVFFVKSGSPCQVDCRPFVFQFDKCTGQVHFKGLAERQVEGLLHLKGLVLLRSFHGVWFVPMLAWDFNRV